MRLENIDYSKGFSANKQNIKNVSMRDIHRVYFLIKEEKDEELNFCYSSVVKNRQYTFYKGEYNNKTFELNFYTKKDCYIWIMKTYGKENMENYRP
jgi:hypothetical protein